MLVSAKLFSHTSICVEASGQWVLIKSRSGPLLSAATAHQILDRTLYTDVKLPMRVQANNTAAPAAEDEPIQVDCNDTLPRRG